MGSESQSESSELSLEPIAIVGMGRFSICPGCHLPGGISSPSHMWDLLSQKRTGWREFTPDRINLDGYYHPDCNRPGSLHTRRATLLDKDPRCIDHSFLGLKEAEVATTDPNQQILLEVVYEAFESAAEPWEKFAGSKTRVFIGNFNTDHSTSQMFDIDFAQHYTTIGGSASILSKIVNHVFNLRGPCNNNITIDTACSSSMYAIQMAVMSIRNGDWDVAIVGGRNLILSPQMQQMTASLGALSATSTSHAFDSFADGYGRGKGFDSKYAIRALIRGTAVNSNSRKAGISHPGIKGQEALIQSAYANAKLPTADTGYFECHGTRTPVRDAVEVAAIRKVFAAHRKSPLLIRSVKTNLRHSESVSGITGIIECVPKLALPGSYV
ncbi:thiolase-like protein [Clohesyomyces aquaticus]|uniref:Thiolase-like protein n=1 Tax=Clohesyomyces aquaticus TaxID=1231657 RepID=A0A1Y1YZB6_9PLEO|nr:thiolase-like protein [Clohesyomyces aquaticus]